MSVSPTVIGSRFGSLLILPASRLIQVSPSGLVQPTLVCRIFPSGETFTVLICQYVPELAGLDCAVVAAASRTCWPDSRDCAGGLLGVALGAVTAEVITTAPAAAAAVRPSPAASTPVLRLRAGGRIACCSRRR